MHKPNLFIIGAMKSGTTSLHNYLNYHPDIFMCEPKEPEYFVEELNYSKGEDWYLSQFASAGRAKYIGESSTGYTKLPVYKGVPEKIKAFNPDAKFIYIMRDPIERIISHYWYSVSTTAMNYDGYSKLETRDMVTAVAEDPEYIPYSDYATQLSPYLNEFGSESIYALTFEDLVDNMEKEVGGIFKWLGLDVLDKFPSEHGVWNKTPSTIQRFKGKGGLQRFRSSGLWSLMSPLIPDSIKQSIKSSIAENVEKETPRELLKYLRPIILPKIESLENMLQRDFNQWKVSCDDQDS